MFIFFPFLLSYVVFLFNVYTKRHVYIFAFGVYNSKQVNVSGIQHYLTQMWGQELRTENRMPLKFTCLELYTPNPKYIHVFCGKDCLCENVYGVFVSCFVPNHSDAYLAIGCDNGSIVLLNTASNQVLIFYHAIMLSSYICL